MDKEKPIEVSFFNKREVRMGSPFLSCSIKLTGKYTPKIEMNDYLDVLQWDDTLNYLALARWDIDKNDPGFNVYIIDIKAKKVIKSKTIDGCCIKIDFAKNLFICSVLRKIEEVQITVLITGEVVKI